MEEQLKNIIKEAVMEVLSEYENKKPQEILSPKELAEWLGVSQAWISVNKDKLQIPYFKCGGDKFYRSDIEDWIEKNKENVNLERQYSRPITINRVKKRTKVG